MDRMKAIAISVYDTILLPDVEYRLSVDTLSHEEEAYLRENTPTKVVILPLKKEPDFSGGGSSVRDFYSYGVEAEVKEIGTGPHGAIMHTITGSRIEVGEVLLGESMVECEYRYAPEDEDITKEGEEELLDTLKSVTRDVARKIRGASNALGYLDRIHSVNEYGAGFLQFYQLSVEEKYALLETSSAKERGLMIHRMLLRFKGTIDLQVDLQRQSDPEQNQYKKQAIQKQMKQLQKELDEIEPNPEKEKNSFEARIEAAGMPEEVRTEVERVLKRFRQEPSHGAEYNSLHDYLDFVTSLKWNPGELREEPIDLKKAKKILDEDHYGLKKVKDRILEHLAVMELSARNNKERKGSILLLVGAPGTGKTSMGRSVARALGREYVRVALGGVRDESEIRGHRRTYVGAMPGRIMEGIKRSGVMNPVVVLDEVDKLQSSMQGDPSAALLEVLDPEQNKTFTDHYLNLPYDLSHVFFICTANSMDSIPRPLLDRMEVISLQGYTPSEHFHIAREHLVRAAMEETGLKKRDIRFTDGALKKIISDYTSEAGVRGLKKQILTVCRKASMEIVLAGEDKDRKPVAIKEKNLEQYLGRRKINHDKVLKKMDPGVVTGLAWTQSGGEILFIETVALKGRGQLHLTGKMGEVMRESAETAYSLVQSRYADSKIDFSHTDIHLHIPEGAVPKDGPSAGITMVTALVSLVTGTAADPHLAMTGEISLRGDVLPIGGLPEKLMAAVRSGVKKVLIPVDNEKDLEEVPKETREKLTIVPVSAVDEVIREALGIRLPGKKALTFGEEHLLSGSDQKAVIATGNL